MTQQTHTEAEQTRELWREYLDTCSAIDRLYPKSLGKIGDKLDAIHVGRVVRLLREQKRILDQLLGGNHEH